MTKKRIAISIDEPLLYRLGLIALQKKTSKSALLCHILERYLNDKRQEILNANRDKFDEFDTAFIVTGKQIGRAHV